MLSRIFRLILGARLPTVEGRIAVPGLDSPVTIRRDSHGVPYVEAGSDNGAFYGVGFCQGQDRAFHLELYRRAARGTLAEIVGEDMLAVDRLSRRIGFSRIAAAQLALVDDATRAQFEAFARGVNDGVRLGLRQKPHELALVGAELGRFEPSDVLAVLQFFAFALSSNWDAELARLRVLQADGPDALAAVEAGDPALLGDRLATDAETVRAALAFASDAAATGRVAGHGGGSNGWALAPSRTSTGRALLASDPHLSPSIPSPWYFVHVRTPRWAMTGACLVTQPVVSFGHNERVAWGLTAGHVDNTDLFQERLGPDGTSVLEGDRYVPCVTRDEIIRVKGRPDVRERVLTTRHGPIVSPLLGGAGGRGAVSLRGTWMASRRVGGYGAFRATTVDEARLCFDSYPATSENRIFADVDGRIAWQMTGDAPVRRKGHGLLPMPGWEPGVGWEDEPLPFDAMPRRVDPADGFVATANQRPPTVDNPSSAFLGADWLDGNRYARIVEALAARRDWDVASTMSLQTDRTSLPWRAMREPVLAALGERASASSKDAVDLLRAWDGIVSAESSAATVFELLFAQMMVRAMKAKAPGAWQAALGEGINVVLPHGMMALRRIEHLTRCLCEQPDGWFARGWPAEMGDALDAVVVELRRRAGPVDRWAWGAVRPIFLQHPVGDKPPLGRIFNLGPIAFGGDGTTIPQASVDFAHPLGNAIGVPNMRMVVDVGNWKASRWVLAGGQSGNPCSPHYADMLDLWQRGDGVCIAWSREDVATAARSVLRLEPAA
jgi:penicillin amidase